MEARPTHADDCELVIRILDGGPEVGMSMQEIQTVATGKHAKTWSLVLVNELLCAIRPHIKHEKVRRKQGKVTLYSLRSKSQP